ncbi:MAG: hypothetical protein ACERKO_12465, partial [Acetanaerobacterium sp.]
NFMEPNFKSAYEEAVKQADEMLNGMNIIVNAALRQRLTQSLAAVKEQLCVAEKVASRMIAKAEYEAEMTKRLAALEQAMNLVTVAAKKNMLAARLAQLQGSIKQVGMMLGNAPRPQQPYNRTRRYR